MLKTVQIGEYFGVGRDEPALLQLAEDDRLNSFLDDGINNAEMTSHLLGIPVTNLHEISFTSTSSPS
jgi:hypothetical protein